MNDCFDRFGEQLTLAERALARPVQPTALGVRPWRRIRRHPALAFVASLFVIGGTAIAATSQPVDHPGQPSDDPAEAANRQQLCPLVGQAADRTTRKAGFARDVTGSATFAC